MKLKRQVSYRPELVEQGVELSVRHLKQYFSFGHGRNAFKTKAVHDVSFDIKKGECFGLVGESGCGKTTTGRSLIKLYHITSGSIYFEGYRISAGRRWNDKEIKWSRIKGRRKIKELRHEYATKISEEADANKKKELAKERDEQIKEIQNRVKTIRKEQKEAIAQIKYDNKHVDRKLMSKMQMIFQDPVDSLDPRMTVEDIIQEGLRIQGEHNRYANSQKVAEVLERVGLIPEYASRYPHEFSGGQRQRIGIARALVMNPQFLICDEPISALDVSIRAQIINLLNDLKEEMGLTIMFIAHDLSVVKYFCDRIGVMYFGQLVELATSDELFRHPLHPYTNALLSAIPKPDPLSEKKRQRIIYKPDEVHDYSEEKPQLVEIVPGHWVLANTPELEKYREVIAKLDKEAAKQKPSISEAQRASESKRQAEEARKQAELLSALKAQEEQQAKEDKKVEEKAPQLSKKELEEQRKAEEAEAKRLAEIEEQKALEARRIARLKEDEERAKANAERKERAVEFRKAHRTKHDDIPALFKPGFVPKREAELSKDELEYAKKLRQYRPAEPASEQKPAFLTRKPVEEETLPMFRKRPEVEVEYVDLKIFHKEEAQPKVVKEERVPSINVPKLASNKLVHLMKNKEGQYILRQVGESEPIATFSNNEEAMQFALELKRVNGVSVCARNDKGVIYNL